MINKVSSVNQSQYPKTNNKQKIAFGTRFIMSIPLKSSLIELGENNKRYSLLEYAKGFVQRALMEKAEVRQASEKGILNDKIAFIYSKGYRNQSENDNILKKQYNLMIFTEDDTKAISESASDDELVHSLKSIPPGEIKFIDIHENTFIADLVSFTKNHLFPVFNVKDRRVLVNVASDGTNEYYKEPDIKNLCSN